jgi:DegV family protein with EDD domain
MGKVKVVTDSTSEIPPAVAQELGISVLPHHISFDSEEYLDGVTITPDEFIARLARTPTVPETQPPTVDEFRDLYTRLAQTTDSIISIHGSAKLGNAYHNASEAKEVVRDRCRVVVVDTQLASMGVGFIVRAAARSANEGASLDDVARLVRSMVTQTHILFFIENMEFIQKDGPLAKVALGGPVANVKPLLRLESGEVFPLERVRTRAKALERLYEFVADFPNIEEMAILYSTTPNEAENLAKRIDSVFPKDRIVVARYGPVLGAQVGLAAMAVVVYEGEE